LNGGSPQHRTKRRLADEYDAAQERGEVAGDGRPKTVPNGNGKATAADLGISRKTIHESRLIRDDEKEESGSIHLAESKTVLTSSQPLPWLTPLHRSGLPRWRSTRGGPLHL
jgi:hypothetical protein